jgi:hypothetical protein
MDAFFHFCLVGSGVFGVLALKAPREALGDFDVL